MVQRCCKEKICFDEQHLAARKEQYHGNKVNQKDKTIKSGSRTLGLFLLFLTLIFRCMF